MVTNRRPVIRIRTAARSAAGLGLRKQLDRAVSRWGKVDYWLWQEDVFARVRHNKELARVALALVREDGISRAKVPHVWKRISERIADELKTQGRPSLPDQTQRGRNRPNEMTPCRVEWYFDKLVCRKEYRLAEQLLAIARRARAGGAGDAE
jgi:hypothetical protein